MEFLPFVVGFVSGGLMVGVLRDWLIEHYAWFGAVLLLAGVFAAGWLLRGFVP